MRVRHYSATYGLFSGRSYSPLKRLGDCLSEQKPNTRSGPH